ncbi:MAG: ANTAR domain-containing protein [Oscillospiraceae bacterium]|nr:ANTAR domain-containing protein [Oscillospiraceae bacterium]
MESALIVSHTDKSAVYLTELLDAASVKHIAVLPSCGEARRLLLERDFDLVIVNAPLRDESGESLSRHIAAKSLSQVILAVKSEYFDAVSAACEGDGVLTVSKPVNRAIFWSALTLAKAACSRLKRMQTENARLKQKIEDIRMIDRAKCILISFMGMSEQDAHRYIEKQAMDMRAAKRVIAEGILRTYENYQEAE